MDSTNPFCRLHPLGWSSKPKLMDTFFDNIHDDNKIPLSFPTLYATDHVEIWNAMMACPTYDGTTEPLSYDPTYHAGCKGRMSI